MSQLIIFVITCGERADLKANNNRDIEVSNNPDISGPTLLYSRDGRFGTKVGQIGPKWDKSGAFSDQVSVHLAPVPFGANLTHFGAKPTIPAETDDSTYVRQ